MKNQKQRSLLKSKLAPILSETFGYFSLLYSQSALELVEDKILIRNQITLVDESYSLKKPQFNQLEQSLKLQCKFEELPIAADSIDLVFLHEVLQRSSFPHQILREAERVLIPDGTIILIIHNPIGLTSLKKEMNNLINRLRKLSKRKECLEYKSQPWFSLSRGRAKDWLNLLGIETINQISVCHDYMIEEGQSPVSILKNNIKQYFYKMFADQTIIVGKKKVSTLTPIRSSWRNNKRFARPRFAEPSVQQHVESCLTQIIK